MTTDEILFKVWMALSPAAVRVAFKKTERRRKRLESNRRWREHNPEKIAKIKKSWARRNLDKRRASQARYAKRHHDKLLARRARYRIKNREMINRDQINVRAQKAALARSAARLVAAAQRFTTDHTAHKAHR